MSKGKKYDYRVSKNRTNWKVEIVRQATSRKSVVSKRQTGFETEAAAKEWAEKELKSFVENQLERNKRKAKQRELRDEVEHERKIQQEQEQKEREAFKKRDKGAS